MTYGNAIAQREEMLKEYERLLVIETDPIRRADIEDRIFQCKDEIAELKNGKPLFGRPKPLRQTTTIIEPDRESPTGQKVTVINPKPTTSDDAVPTLSPIPTPKTTKRLENNLRAQIQQLKANKTKA